jgi:hypothetical protein
VVVLAKIGLATLQCSFTFHEASIMLSIVLFANSCSIEVDVVVWIPTHTKDSKTTCVHGR